MEIPTRRWRPRQAHLVPPPRHVGATQRGDGQPHTKPSVLPFYPPSSYGWVGPTILPTLFLRVEHMGWYMQSQSLYNHAQSTPILEHWSKRRNIPCHMIRSIDWEACAIKLLGLTRSLWIPKWLAGFAPVGKVQQRNMFQDHAECPRRSAFETTAHVLLYPPPPQSSPPVGLVLVQSRPADYESPYTARPSKRDHHLPPLVAKPRWRPPRTLLQLARRQRHHPRSGCCWMAGFLRRRCSARIGCQAPSLLQLDQAS
jgi:hypothetical protein